jgi:hypothetical protein
MKEQLDKIKNHLKEELFAIFKTDLMVFKTPTVHHPDVIYCIFNQIEILPSANYYRFSIKGVLQKLKSNNETEMGFFTESSLKALLNNNNNITFFYEKIEQTLHSIDFNYVSDKIYIKASSKKTA